MGATLGSSAPVCCGCSCGILRCIASAAGVLKTVINSWSTCVKFIYKEFYKIGFIENHINLYVNYRNLYIYNMDQVGCRVSAVQEMVDVDWCYCLSKLKRIFVTCSFKFVDIWPKCFKIYDRIYIYPTSKFQYINIQLNIVL